MPRRRLPLGVAVALALLAALLFALSDGARPAASAPAPEFPRYAREAETKRIEARRTLPPPDALVGPLPAGAEPPPRRDPFLVALPRDPKRSLLVLEANALRHSRVGELFVDCLFRAGGRDPFQDVRRDFGIDPLKDVDRIALADDGVVISGFFDDARFERLEAESDATSYGDAGTVYRSRVAGQGRGAARALGRWGGSILVVGDPAFVEASIDRLEGRAPQQPPVIPEYLTYGEAYGVLSGEGFGPLFRGEHAALGRRLAEIASRIELHADAMRDVAITARVSGADDAGVNDLGSAFGAALAIARVQARARGDEQLTQLLEHARVERRTSGFNVEVAIPVALLETWFAGCGEAPRRDARTAAEPEVRVPAAADRR